MADLILSQLFFYVVCFFVLYVPGRVLLMAVFPRSKSLSILEIFIISPALSIISVDFISFFLHGINLPVSRPTLAAGISLFAIACLSIFQYRLGRKKYAHDSESSEETASLFNFSKRQFYLLIFLIAGTILIKTAYLTDTVLPSSTDMGHHMYWAKWMAENNALPSYEGMPDFIIGEHIIFGALAMLTGMSVMSAFPVVILYAINILGILTTFILTLRIFKNRLLAILIIFFLGVLYAVSSPQAKYVSGGVIGNLMGNMLMPLAFYFYYRTFDWLNRGPSPVAISPEKTHESRVFLSLAVFTTSGLFFTHHLTSFILLFIFAFLAIFLLVAYYQNLERIFPTLKKIIFSKQPIIVLLFSLIFFFFVFPPTFVSSTAIGTAVGEATKSSRIGLTFADLESSIGEPRLAIGLVGLLFLLLSWKKWNFGHLLIVSWTFMLLIMSTEPHLLFVDLPSSRIGNYLVYPFSILSAYGLWVSFSAFSKNSDRFKNTISSLSNAGPHYLLSISFFVILAVVAADGFRDSALAFKQIDNSQKVITTQAASGFVLEYIGADDNIIKDHNYITADSWIKLYFMRGYKYPLSRGFFSRYEATGSRSTETCTLVMISNPGSSEAEKCFDESKVNFLMISPDYDSAQFKKLTGFDAIYNNGDVAVYRKNQ